MIQNETHALNFAAIVQRLIADGVSVERIQVLHLDPIYGQRTRELIAVPGQRVLDLPIAAPYYHLRQQERLRWLLQAAPALRAAVAGSHLIVIGSDGGVQRVMANAVRNRGGKAVLLLDGMLQPWPPRYPARLRPWLKAAVNKFAASIQINPFVPADIGHSQLDHILVMHEAVREVLRDQGVKAPIDVVFLPRFDCHREQFAALRAATPALERRCLFVTGAFRWHGLHKLDQQQQCDLEDLRRFAVAYPDWSVRIRVHPRDDRAAYQSQSWPHNIELSFSERPAVEDLAWASVMVTWISTMGVEAEMVGLPVAIYTANMGPLPPGSYFARNPYFRQVTALDELIMMPAVPAELAMGESSVGAISDLLRSILL